MCRKNHYYFSHYNNWQFLVRDMKNIETRAPKKSSFVNYFTSHQRTALFSSHNLRQLR